MVLNVALLLFVLAGVAGLGAMALRDHRRELKERAALLDGLRGRFDAGQIEIGGDGFPTLTARLADRRQLTVSLLPDTLVMRRLPQLWLIVTLHERLEKPRPSIGALARSTGVEFYSQTLNFPQRVDTAAGLDPALLLRGDRQLSAADLDRVVGILGSIFQDAHVKEIAATPRGVRMVRQVSEGDRGSHLLLRQARFGLTRLDSKIVASSIEDADAFRAALDRVYDQSLKLSA